MFAWLLPGLSLAALVQILLSRSHFHPPPYPDQLQGVYYRSAAGHYNVLRFYADGLVMQVSIKTEDLLDAWNQINQWFHRHSQYHDLNHGHYLIHESYLGFEFVQGNHRFGFYGCFQGPGLLLNSHNTVTGQSIYQEYYQPLVLDEASMAGVYAFSVGSRHQVFRFYEDGTVLNATVFSDDLEEGWERISSWFNAATDHLMVRRGRYCVQEGHLRFIIGWAPQRTGSGIRYHGLIRDDSLWLESNTHGRQEYRRVNIPEDSTY
jgi:hypothetical protein